MFHWICPECGREIAPAVKECPACDPASASETLAEAELVAAGPVRAEQPQAALTPEVVFAPSVDRRHSRHTGSTAAVLTAADVLTIDAEVEESADAIDETPVPEFEPQAQAADLGVADLAAANLATADEEPVFSEPVANTEPATDAEPVSDVEPAVAAELLAEAEPAAEITPDPPKSISPAPQPVEAQPPQPPAPAAAPPAPLRAVEPAVPVAAKPKMERAIEHLPDIVVTDMRPASSRARELALADDPIRDVEPPRPVEPAFLPGMPAGPEPLQPAAALRPKLASGGPRPPMGWLVSDMDAVFARLRAAEPSRAACSKPREQFSLPGPALPHELTSLEGAGISKILQPRKAKAKATAATHVPGWVLSAMVAVTLLATCLSAALYLMPAGAAPAPEPKAPPPVVAQDPGSPLAKFVEVTGIRHVTLGDRSEIRYLVVNHSAALINDVTVSVTLRGPAGGPNAAPVSTFAFKMPNLGPWESKEMISPVERVLRPGAMPEWSDLTAEIKIEQ